MEEIASNLQVAELQKAYELFQAQASYVSSFSLRWKDLLQHFNSISKSMEDLNVGVEEIDSNGNQRLGLGQCPLVLPLKEEQSPQELDLDVREIERLIQKKENDYAVCLQESIMESSAELDLKEKELALVQKLIEECRIKRQLEEQRLHSLEGDIEERSKELENKEKQLGSIQGQLSFYCQDIEIKEKEYGEIRRSIEERNREFEAKGEQLKSMQKLISECERQLRLKEEECNWELEMVQLVIGERDEVLKKLQRKIEECDKDLGAKEERLSLIEDLIIERKQELRAKDIEFHKVMGNIDKDRERKEEELKALLKKIAECTKELKTKEEELDAMQRLINGQAKELELKRKNLLKSIGSNKKDFDSLKQLMKEKSLELEKKEKQLEEGVNDLESMKKHYEGRAKELKSKEKQFEGRVKELKSKEKQFEVQVKELESKEKRFEGQVKDLESKQNQFEGHGKELELKEKQLKVQVNELELKEKQFEGQVKDLESKQNQFEGQVKELELKEKQFEVQVKELKSKEKQFEGQVKELELKEKRFEVQVKEFKSKEKHFEGQVKDLESKQNQFEGQLKELELKEKQYESLRKSLEEEKVLKEKPKILLPQVKTEQLYFKDVNSVNNSKNLQVLLKLLKEYELMCSQVSDALRTSADPAKLVLDAMKGFYPPHLRQENVDYDANILRRICNFLMDELKKSSPVTSFHVKQEAMKLASDWKANMAVADKDCSEVLGFLNFVATYGIGSSFNANELQRLLDIIAQHCQASRLQQELGNIEKLPDNQLSPTTDGRNLQLLSNEQTNAPELIDNDILVNLQTSSDPAKLVLDIIQNPIVPQCRKGDIAVIIDGSHIFLLEQLMRISPHIKPHVREEAMKLALDLKANMTASTENSLVVLGFLLLLSIYGLVSSFNEDEVLKLFEFAARHKQAVELFRALGFVDKISDFVQNLIKKQQHIEAVRFICAYKLADKIQPVDLLRQFVRKARRISKKLCKKKPPEIKDKVGDQEIASLGAVLQCISDNNLESQDLLKEIQDRILKLKSLKVRTASGPSSKVEVQQPKEKKRANEVVTNNHQLQQCGNNSKRPRTAVTRSVPSVFSPKYRHVMPCHERGIPRPSAMPAQFGIPRPSAMPAQFGFPTNYFGLANPMGVGRVGNSGTNYFCHSGSYPPSK